MGKRYIPAAYAFGHFLVDFCCCHLLLTHRPSTMVFLLYNFCAFALQMPIGLLADHFRHSRCPAVIGGILVLLSAIPSPITFRVLLAGLGNACFHVGGGRNALLCDRKLTGLGLFVSPGAIGIYLGVVLSGRTECYITALGALLAVSAYLLFYAADGLGTSSHSKLRISPAVVMLSVVILRSVVGLSMESPWKIGIYVAFGALAAALGKAMGGILSDKFGWRRTGILSLLLAGALFLLPDSAIAGVAACLLFNMTMPISLRRASDALPGMEGFAFGLLTFGLFLGYLPSLFGFTITAGTGMVLSLLSALLLLLDHD